MKTITLNLIAGGTVEVDVAAIRLVQAEAKGCTVMVRNEGEPPKSYHVYESISRLRALMG